DDFSFSPIAITVPLAGTGSTAVTVNSIAEFNSTVNLSVSGQPGGLTASLAPVSVTPLEGSSASSTLQITVGPSVSAGTYNLTVNGVSPTVTHTAPALVYVAPSASGTSEVVGALADAGCIDDQSVVAGLTDKLAALQTNIAQGNLNASMNNVNALLN